MQKPVCEKSLGSRTYVVCKGARNILCTQKVSRPCFLHCFWCTSLSLNTFLMKHSAWKCMLPQHMCLLEPCELLSKAYPQQSKSWGPTHMYQLEIKLLVRYTILSTKAQHFAPSYSWHLVLGCSVSYNLTWHMHHHKTVKHASSQW